MHQNHLWQPHQTQYQLLTQQSSTLSFCGRKPVPIPPAPSRYLPVSSFDGSCPASTANSFHKCLWQNELELLATLAASQQWFEHGLQLAQTAFEEQMPHLKNMCTVVQRHPICISKQTAITSNSHHLSQTMQTTNNNPATGPSQLNTKYLQPSGDYNTAAIGVPLFKFSFYLFLPFLQKHLPKEQSTLSAAALWTVLYTCIHHRTLHSTLAYWMTGLTTQEDPTYLRLLWMSNKGQFQQHMHTCMTHPIVTNLTAIQSSTLIYWTIPYTDQAWEPDWTRIGPPWPPPIKPLRSTQLPLPTQTPPPPSSYTNCWTFSQQSYQLACVVWPTTPTTADKNLLCPP